MKTKLQILSIALLGLAIASCSSSMNMSKSSSYSSDDIYYTPSKTTSSLDDVKKYSDQQTSNQDTSKKSFAELENKYSRVSAADSINVDTLIYKAESTNPYERVLSNSYRESYERRLRGMEDPRYKTEDFVKRLYPEYIKTHLYYWLRY